MINYNMLFLNPIMSDIIEVKEEVSDLIWFEIDEKRLRHNLRLLRNRLGEQSEICAVIKGNAYGHGMAEIAALLLKNKVDKFAVFHAKEARELRAVIGPSPTIFQLGYSSASTVLGQIENDIHAMIVDLDQIDLLENCIPFGQQLKVHIKINTGMNRFGIQPEELTLAIDKILKSPKFILVGAVSHFADSWNFEEPGFTENQRLKFSKCLELINDKCGQLDYCHIANSGGIQVHEKAHYQMSRSGINIYGYYSHRSLYEKDLKENRETFLPILSFRTKVVSVKPVSKGEFVGYDRTFEVKKDMKIAIVPIGYSDGFPFLNGEYPSYVLIKGQRAYVVGRVNMNILLLDVTNIKNIKVDDVATILGVDGEEEISAWNWREWGSTHLYESLTKLRMDIPRRINHAK